MKRRRRLSFADIPTAFYFGFLFVQSSEICSSCIPNDRSSSHVAYENTQCLSTGYASTLFPPINVEDAEPFRVFPVLRLLVMKKCGSLNLHEGELDNSKSD
jgi:hypothetical protein